MPEAGRKRGYWGVKDTLAVNAARTHEAISGALYALKANEFTWMPPQDAATFLKDPAFKVINDDEQPVATVASKPDEHAIGGLTLQPGQVIANYAELTSASLRVRCHQIPGGETFGNNARKDDMIAFLVENEGDPSRAARTAGDRAQEAADADDLEEMNDDDAKEMLGDGDQDEAVE